MGLTQASYVGVIIFDAARNTHIEPVFLIDITLRDANNYEYTRWCRSFCLVRRGQVPVGWARTSGNWLRHLVFTATAPDGNGTLWLSRLKTGITNELPRVDDAYVSARGPDYQTYGLPAGQFPAWLGALATYVSPGAVAGLPPPPLPPLPKLSKKMIKAGAGPKTAWGGARGGA
jgi:hypothetical protein